MLRRLFLALPLVLAPTFAAADSLAGAYAIEGRNPNGTTYAGSARIDEESDGLRFTWTVGNSTFDGLAFQDGRVVVVDWGQPSPVVYVVMSNGELHGTWADGTGLDKLTPR